jgi:Flp pilus assembly protein TadB
MAIVLTLFLIAVLLFCGLTTFCLAQATKEYSCTGHRTLSRMSGWERKRVDAWSVFPLKQLQSITARLIYVDEATATGLRKTLSKAKLTITPEEYTARKVLIVAFGLGLTALCFFTRFYFGIVIVLLVTVYAMMKQRDALSAKARKKEFLISQEMPRFVRTICRNLQNDRDLYNVISSYRKVAGPELSGELDILLAEMKSGNVQTALIHFEDRLGSPEAFRLCSALRDMSLGVDQTATLAYMADDMARAAKENIRKELSLRPGKMRRTYYPAIAVCIVMILYVLVVYVINNLNSIL